MGLSSSLDIARSGLAAGQTGIELTGNNIANASTPGYHRRRATLSTAGEQQIGPGQFLGRGVKISEITRLVDGALETRLRGAISDREASAARQTILEQIESIHGELSEVDVSSALSEFFNAWSQLSTQPEESSFRTLLMEEAGALAGKLRQTRQELTALRGQVDDQIDEQVRSMDQLLNRLAEVDRKLVATEKGQGGAHDLRDQRGQLLGELSELVDISTVERDNGGLDVYVGSLPVVLNGESRGVEVRRRTVDGELQIDVKIRADGSALDADSGKIGRLIQAREQDVNQAVDRLDDFARSLIREVNRVHTGGQGLEDFTAVTAVDDVLDPAVPLDGAAAGLAFTPQNGSFVVRLTQQSTGQTRSTTIDVDLDQVEASNNTTLNDLASSLDAVANLDASVDATGRLRIEAASSDYTFSFAEDSSGVLASLGINTFFEGGSAHDIAVKGTLTPDQIAAAKDGNAQANALEIARLRDASLTSLGGQSLTEQWSRQVEDYAVRLAQTRSELEAGESVVGSLRTQQQQISGVNIDEETINLLQFQRTYQASARFLNVVNELMDTLLASV